MYDRTPGILKSIVTVQNKIIRAIFRKPKYDRSNNQYTEMSPLYTQLNVLKVHELYYYNLGVLVHDYFNKSTFPELLKEQFDTFRSDKPQNTRSSSMNLNYKVPNYITTYRKPTIAGSMFWNSLPNDIKCIADKKSFKNKLKCHLLKRYKINEV